MKPNVAIVGVGETRPVRRSDKDIRALVVEAVLSALDDAGISPHEVDGFISDGMIMPTTVPHDYVAAQLGATSRFDAAISLSGAGMVNAPLQAAFAIQSGLANVIVAYFGVDWGTRPGGPYGFHSIYPAKVAFEKPYGFDAQPTYFALWARRYMREYGLTEEQLGAVAVQHRKHALLNGKGQMTKPMSLDDYFASSLLAEPLRIADCCLITDGACAFVMTSPDRARDFKKKPVNVLGTGFASEPISGEAIFTQKPSLTTIPGAQAASEAALKMANIDITDVDFAEIYDCFTISLLLQFEDMGFCKKGEAGTFFEEGRAAIDGDLPVNTHGGLLSYSYRLGVEHIVEAVRQLRGEAGNAQVADAEIGLVSGLSLPDYGVLILGKN